MKALKGGWKSLYIITSKTTKDDLYVFDKITTEDKLVADSDGFVEFTPSSVDVSDFLNTLDIFGDGSCIACYTFDGNANDLSGNYNGTWNGNEQYDIGKFGQAAKFDGSSYINTGLDLNDNLVSLSFWINTIEYKDQFIMGTDDNSSTTRNFRILLWSSNGIDNELQIWFGGDTDCKEYYTHFQIVPKNWYHIYFVVDVNNSVSKIYVNGNLVKTMNDIYSGFDTLVIGDAGTASSSYKLSGLIDQVRIFNRALIEEEIKILYNGEKYYHCQLPSSLNKAPTKVFKKASPSIWVSKVFEQESGENDWYQYQAEVKEKPEEVKIISATKDEIKTPEIIIKGEKLLLYSDEKIVEKSVDSYPETINTVNVLDIFGDGSCIACYPFNGNANDLGGNYNGSWSGNEQYSSGKFGQAAKFDGTSGTGVIIPPPTTSFNFSISFWVKTSNAEVGDLDATNTIIGLDKNAQYTNDFCVGLAKGKLKVCVETNTDGDKVFDTGKFIANNEWHLVVVNFNVAKDGSFDVFVDGVWVYSNSVTATPSMESYNWGIGCLAQDGSVYTGQNSTFHGLIDQVRIFNKPLTEDEIKALYNEKLYKVNISSFNLTNPPEKAWKEPTKVYVAMESTPDRCLWKDEDLSDQILNSTTDSIEVVDSRKNIILPKDIIIIDSDKEIEVENVTLTDSTQILDIFGDGSCIATYTFDGNADDLSGNYNGSWNGNEQYDVGKFGQSAKFDGNSYINTNISNFPSTVTLSLWFKQSAIDTSTHHCLFCFSKDGKNTLNLWQYATDTKKKMYFDINDSHIESLPKFYEDNIWHHLVIVSSGKVYIDGEKVLDIPSVDLSVVNKPLLIGADWDSDKDNPNDFVSSGTYIDQIRIFNRALSEKEVKILYNEGYKHLINIPTQSSAPTKLIVPDRTIEQTLLTREYDETNNIIKSTYKTARKNGRAIRVKLEGNKDTLVNNLKVNLWTGE